MSIVILSLNMAWLTTTAVLLFSSIAVSALPAQDPVLMKWSSGLRYQYREDADGNLHLVDQWMKASTFAAAARYNPDRQNVYHIFTRQNQQSSQPILLNADAALRASNFRPNRPTAVIIHGWAGSATAPVNTVLVPAFLRARDCNVIVVDWSAGASVLVGDAAPLNAITSGRSVARAIDWIRRITGAPIGNFHLLGFSLGAHQAAVVGRNTNGRIPYVTALDPGANMENSGHIFSPNAGTYTEAIHTSADVMGHGSPLAHSDFYPNGGDGMPGCGLNFLCNHDRSFHYFAETITINGGFTGQRCATYLNARFGLCNLPIPLRMGGLTPKIGGSGIFHLVTNANSPFNRG